MWGLSSLCIDFVKPRPASTGPQRTETCIGLLGGLWRACPNLLGYVRTQTPGAASDVCCDILPWLFRSSSNARRTPLMSMAK